MILVMVRLILARIWNISNYYDADIHEAPVWSPATNKLYISDLSPESISQIVVDLNVEPPKLGNLVTDPPVYGLNGGTIHNGT